MWCRRGLAAVALVLLAGVGASAAAASASSASSVGHFTPVLPGRAIRDVSLSANSPAMEGYVPTSSARVVAELRRWLAQAKLVAEPITPTNQPVLHAYLGPARLYFKDGLTGKRVSVYPDYYLVSHGSDKAVTIHYFSDIIRYVYNLGGPNGGTSWYFRDPELYKYLTNDTLWHKQFRSAT